MFGPGRVWTRVSALLTVWVTVDVGADELQRLLQKVAQGNHGELQQVGALASGPEHQRRAGTVVHSGGVPAVLLVVRLHGNPTYTCEVRTCRRSVSILSNVAHENCIILYLFLFLNYYFTNE